METHSDLMMNEGWRSPVKDDDQDDRTYKVVLNHEEQYSIWPAERDNAPGWRDAGQTGTKAECLAYIERVWTDMRPLSLRRRMDQAESGDA
jgi:MbtH protein